MSPSTDTTEKGLEALIVSHLTGLSPEQVERARRDGAVAEGPVGYDSGWLLGFSHDYDREHAVDLAQLMAFLEVTQPERVARLNIGAAGTSRDAFLNRVQGQVASRGIVDVLRKGIDHHSEHIDLYSGLPSPGNTQAAALFAKNRFSITRQLRYSKDGSQRALDMAVFINGLPFATVELKNRWTGQTWRHAVKQYQQDRSPKELLFQFGRCAVHFAMDDDQVHFCTRLAGKNSTFLPFNKGFNDGAGNPPDPAGPKTSYFWHDLRRRERLAEVIERYVQLVPDEKKLIFPRYHQIGAVRALLADADRHGPGKRYLIQHSAGSGKSNTIAWLADQLIDLSRDGKPLFDSVIVVTDRRVLDKQLRDTVKRMSGSSWAIGAAERSGQLREFIQQGKRIITTTVQKFPMIVDDIGSAHRGRTFAIVIDEAHSSQGGRAMTKLNATLASELEVDQNEEGEVSYEDLINLQMVSRKMLDNASYFAFTATPKNKTLEIFGTRQPDGKFKAFHEYTMKQAIEEGFIMDVLQQYTPVKSYYRVTKTVEADPEYDVGRARKKLWAYVEGHDHAIRRKAEIMVDHFHDNVRHKVGSKARTMVATTSIRQAIAYWESISAYLKERKSPYRAIVAFSGEVPLDGRQVSESTLNGFPSNDIPKMFGEEPYRFLIVANKFLTGFDQPLLHTMYVDKPLAGIQAVQTLSRLNRSHPDKRDTFILDFENDAGRIEEAFQPYYTGTSLTSETDPNKLHDLKRILDDGDVYTWPRIEEIVGLFISGAGRDQIDPLLDGLAARYTVELDEDRQVLFKGNAKQFVRTYNFLSSLLTYTNPAWEKLSIVLTLLVPRLPAPTDRDDTAELLANVDMDSYRVEVKATQAIRPADGPGEIEPVPIADVKIWEEAERDLLSNIVRMFNDLVGDIEWTDRDRIETFVTETVPDAIANDARVRSAFTHSDEQNRRKEVEEAVKNAIIGASTDHLELYNHFAGTAGFEKQLQQMIYDAVALRLRAPAG